MNINFFNILMILGSIQGFLIAALLLLGPQFRKSSNLFLGILVFTISLQNLSNSLIDMGFQFLEFWPLSWTLLIPFALKYFVQFLINANHTFEKKNYLELLPFAGQFLYKSNIFIISFVAPEYLENQSTKIQATMVSMELMAVVWCLFVVVELIRHLKSYELNLPNHYANLEGKSLHWLKQTLIFTAIIWFFWAFSFVLIQYYPALSYLSYFNWISLAMVIYWLAISIIIRRKVFESPAYGLGSTPASPKALPLKSEEHYQQIIQLMEKEFLFREASLDMEILAAKLKLSKGYVSQIINQNEGKNFFEFVNHYRVNDVKAKISNPQFSHLSLLGIALEAGFSSKSTFNSAFKKLTGSTPSAYQKQTSKHD